MKVNNIYEDSWIKIFLEKRNLLKQYVKSKNHILKQINSKTFFKERKPKWCNIWYFRINNQFRAIWSIDKDNDLIIFKIDNHSKK